VPEFNSFQVSPGQISFAQASVIQNGIAEVGSGQVSFPESSISEFSTTQIGTTQIGAEKACLRQVSTTQIGTTQIGTVKGGLPQDGTTQIGITQIGMTQADLIHPSSTQIGTTQISSNQVSTTEFSSTQVSPAQVGTTQLLGPTPVTTLPPFFVFGKPQGCDLNIDKISLPSSVTLEQFLKSNTLPLHDSVVESLDTVNNSGLSLCEFTTTLTNTSFRATPNLEAYGHYDLLTTRIF
jgi:hypothetical protein